MDKMYDILGEEKANQREQIKIRADALAHYFPEDFTPRQKVELIEKLVKEQHEKRGGIFLLGIGRICNLPECDVSNIMEYIPDNNFFSLKGSEHGTLLPVSFLAIIEKK